MTLWAYVVENAAWSLGGLCLGYLLGRIEREYNHEEGRDDHP